jgi:hypothetical protein
MRQRGMEEVEEVKELEEIEELEEKEERTSHGWIDLTARGLVQSLRLKRAAALDAL